MFINDDLSNEEWDTYSNHEEEIYSDNDVSSSNQEESFHIFSPMIFLKNKNVKVLLRC